jgi:hypothetical protein
LLPAAKQQIPRVIMPRFANDNPLGILAVGRFLQADPLPELFKLLPEIAEDAVGAVQSAVLEICRLRESSS